MNVTQVVLTASLDARCSVHAIVREHCSLRIEAQATSCAACKRLVRYRFLPELYERLVEVPPALVVDDVLLTTRPEELRHHIVKVRSVWVLRSKEILFFLLVVITIIFFPLRVFTARAVLYRMNTQWSHIDEVRITIVKTTVDDFSVSISIKQQLLVDVTLREPTGMIFLGSGPTHRACR